MAFVGLRTVFEKSRVKLKLSRSDTLLMTIVIAIGCSTIAGPVGGRTATTGFPPSNRSLLGMAAWTDWRAGRKMDQ